MIQETKLKPDEKIKCERENDFQIFYLNRQKSQGGGVALGVEKNIESTLIREGDDELEVISVQVVLGDVPVRIVVGYGPQENDKIEKKKNFWEFLEKEIHEAELNEHGFILQMDGNLHAGDLVENDPNPKNRNGDLFRDFLERNKCLVVLNCLQSCKGVITRRRVLESRTEESVLDFFVINEKLRPFFKDLLIDEEREFCLSNVAQIKKNKRVVETDHNAMIAEFNLKINKRKPDREEMFNLRNGDCQDIFKQFTDDSPELLSCFENNLPIEEQSRKWNKTLKSLFYKSFKKVRIVNNKKKEDTKLEGLLTERIKVKQELKHKNISEEMKKEIEKIILQIELEMENEVTEEYQR